MLQDSPETDENPSKLPVRHIIIDSEDEIQPTKLPRPPAEFYCARCESFQKNAENALASLKRIYKENLRLQLIADEYDILEDAYRGQSDFIDQLQKEKKKLEEKCRDMSKELHKPIEQEYDILDDAYCGQSDFIDQPQKEKKKLEEKCRDLSKELPKPIEQVMSVEEIFSSNFFLEDKFRPILSPLKVLMDPQEHESLRVSRNFEVESSISEEQELQEEYDILDDAYCGQSDFIDQPQKEKKKLEEKCRDLSKELPKPIEQVMSVEEIFSSNFFLEDKFRPILSPAIIPRPIEENARIFSSLLEIYSARFFQEFDKMPLLSWNIPKPNTISSQSISFDKV